MEPPVLSCRFVAAYVPLRVTMQRKRACVNLFILYNGRLEKTVSQSPNTISYNEEA